ncbi:MAG: DUF3237 domain-containing protein [Rubritepida sp.]|nr:DUF3237 domain-containing protein [Rubritepida sp.]
MAPLPLDTEYLFTMDIAVGVPQAVSEGLRVVPVVGGTVHGPALTGEVVGGASADWLRLEPDGTAHMDVRLTIRAASGALVYVHYTGIRTGPAEVLARLGAGEAVPPSDYYFRVAIRFETGDATLAWMNRVLAIGVGQRPPAGPRYDVYAVR